MQQFLIDIDKPTGLLVLYAKQADSMSRFFSVSLFSGGAEWEPPAGSALTVRFGAPGMPAGWYDTITEPDGGSHSAFSVDGNTITVELAEQAVSTPGTNTVALLINGADGYQLASWNFTLMIEPVPGLEAPEATVYYNALAGQVAQTLANANAAAASAAAAAASAASVDADKLVNIIGGTAGQVPVISGAGYQWESFSNIKALQNIVVPVGYILSWAPVDGGPDLSTPEKVAAYYGFGTWAAYGPGQVLVGVDSGQTEFATVGKTGGEKAHSLTTAEGPKHAHGVKWEHEGGLGTGNGVLIKDANDGESYPYTYFTEFSGSGQAHNNLQPYITVYRWQRIA